MDNNSISHTKRNCKYHVVFTPKFRRKIFYVEKQPDDIRKMGNMKFEYRNREFGAEDTDPFMGGRCAYLRLYYSFQTKL